MRGDYHLLRQSVRFPYNVRVHVSHDHRQTRDIGLKRATGWGKQRNEKQTPDFRHRWVRSRIEKEELAGQRQRKDIHDFIRVFLGKHRVPS